MTHATRLLTRAFFALSFITCTGIFADAVDDAITTHTATYDAKVLEEVELRELLGDDRVNEATPMHTDLGTLATDIQAVIDNTAGHGIVPSAGQNTTLTTLKTAVVTLDKRVEDHITLGTQHAAVADALEALAKIDIESSQTTNLGHVTTGKNAIDSHITDLETMATANGIGIGTAGALKHADSETEFDAEHARAVLAQELSVLVQTLLARQGDLGTAIDAAPSADDDTVSNYDTQLNDAQAAIEDEAELVFAAATPASNKALAIVATEVENDNYSDYIVEAAEQLDKRINQFKNDATKTIKKVATTRGDIGVRIVQRQLLFDARNYSEREAIKATLSDKYSTRNGANDELQGVFADVAELIENDPTTFPDTPPPAVGGRSAMGQLIDARVKTYLGKLESVINKLNPSPANQSLVDDVLESLKPSVYIVETSYAMIDWLKTRPGKLRLAGDFTSTRDQYQTEWAELAAELDANVAESTISSATQSDIGAHTSHASYTSLTPIANGDSLNPRDGASFARRASVLKGRRGILGKIKSKGTAEYRTKLSALIGDISKGSVDQSPTHRSNKQKPAAITRPLNDTPDVTIDAASSLTTDLADGTQMVITGGEEGTVGRMRDPVFASGVSNKLDADLKIFLNKSARIGLGAGNINSAPGQTPNVLGGASEGAAKSVQLIPDGNCTIDVNSDLLIGGSKPFIPTLNFGKGAEHRMLFYSETEKKITVAANTTLDLSEFGNDGDEYTDNGKQIVFGGKVTLVLEVGAKIRFPHVDPNKEKKGAVLYFNDEAQLICKDDNYFIGKPWTGDKLLGADCKRNKLIGMGQLWFNKGAKMVINKPALVSVEADFLTPETNITISLQRNAQMLIGTESQPGGAFQVGNILEGGSKVKPHATEPDTNFPNNSTNSDSDFTPNKTTIDFTLKIDGVGDSFLKGAKCLIGRSGFLGFAAGVVNKDGARSFLNAGPNGIDGISNTAWQLQRLYNVGSITLDITRGNFDHNFIGDGDNADCSMLAIGALANHFPESKYLLKLGKPTQSIIRGGGNVYFVDKDASMVVDGASVLTANPHTVSITDAALGLSFTTSNTGKATILAPSVVMRNRSDAISGVTDYRVFGRGIVKSDSNSYVFAGPTEEFFYTLGLDEYKTGVSLRNENFVPFGGAVTAYSVVYIDNANTVQRPKLPKEYTATETVKEHGFLEVFEENSSGLPENYRS